jgi:hypothetical protein
MCVEDPGPLVGEMCDDGDAGTEFGTCMSDGTCEGQIAGCVTDADCTDGVFCNGLETCEGGVCVSGVVDCGVADQCNTVGCDVEQDACVTTPLSGGFCDDGSVFTGPDTCNAGVCAGIGVCEDKVDGTNVSALVNETVLLFCTCIGGLPTQCQQLQQYLHLPLAFECR